MDVALDDVIKSQKQKFSLRNKRQIRVGNGVNRQQGGKFKGPQRKVGVKSGRVGDVRSKINQRLNAKMKVQDARELLSANKIRKVSDARQLIKSQAGTAVVPNKPRNQQQQQQLPDFIIPTKVVRNDKYKKPAPPPVPNVRVQYERSYDSNKQSQTVRRQNPTSALSSRRLQSSREAAPIPTIQRHRPMAPTTRPPQQPIMVPFEEPVPIPRVRSRSPPVRRREPPPQPVSVIQGFKVSIANLHPGVSREDIYELFSSVGPVKKCVLVRPGEAEVVYPKKDDAMAAVRRYDRRELDGMAMKLKVSTVGIKTMVPGSHASHGSVPVDAHAIQAALFSRSNASRRPVNFQVSI